MTVIETRDLRKNFGENEILCGIDFAVTKGEVVSVIGASGSGKSTFLRCINLLEQPTSGDILYHGESILGAHYNVHRYRAKVGMVFQQFNLFNNLSALENCVVGQVKVGGKNRSDARATALSYLDRVGLAQYVNAKPRQLSGGQKQRVAIARALSMEPEALLFDEPTSALDPEMVGEVLECIRELAQSGLTMMIVTHEMEFARQVSHRVAYMADGVMFEVGTPDEVFLRPKNERTRAFLGSFGGFAKGGSPAPQPDFKTMEIDF